MLFSNSRGYALTGVVLVAAKVCYLDQEQDQRGKLRWVKPVDLKDRCSCTSIRPGGVNMYTPQRHYEPHYTDHPLFTDDQEKIRMYFNCQVCSVDTEEHLGMENGDIPDDSITASSFWHNKAYTAPHRTRLNTQGYAAAWCAGVGDSQPWIQVDFNTTVSITGLITQGRASSDRTDQWVKTFNVSIPSDSGHLWGLVTDTDGAPMEFIGNTDGDTQVTTRFREVLYTTAIRIQPTSWNNYCSMRFEVIGCYH